MIQRTRHEASLRLLHQSPRGSRHHLPSASGQWRTSCQAFHVSNFTDPLILIDIDGNLWKTEREFSYHVGSEDSADVITVPQGFETDLASIPWPASMLLPKSGIYNQAAVLHDYLYTTQTRPRAEADHIFLEAMKTLGVSWWIRTTMYTAVRLFGRYRKG